MYKRIIPLILILAIVFSFSIVPVYAYADTGWLSKLTDLEGSINGLIDDAIWVWQYDSTHDYYGCTATPDGKHLMNVTEGGLVATGDCTMCHLGLNQIAKYDYQNGGFYGEYEPWVNKTFPVPGYDNTGGLIWIPTWADFKGTVRISNSYIARSGSVSSSQYDFFSFDNTYFDLSASVDGYFYLTTLSSTSLLVDLYWTRTSSTTLGITFSSCSFTVPISGTYIPLSVPFVFDNYGGSSLPTAISGVSKKSGEVLNASFPVHKTANSVSSVVFQLFLPQYRVIPSVDFPDINIIYAPSTRIGGINFNLATVDTGDNITNVFQNVQIVNEENNTFYNPATGQTSNIKSWTYDYHTRSYTLTLDDGSIVKVTFGDAGITIEVNGEIQNEFKYVVEGSGGGSDPGPEYPDDPDIDDGFLAWLKQWLISFKEWLGEKLDALLAKDSSGDTIYNDYSQDIDITNNNYDYDISYKDEDGEEKETSLLKLLHKFDFLRDVYDMGRTLFSVVAADAAAAYAYDPDAPMAIAVNDGVMPLAGGAPSLKLNLGAANSHFGFDYGGEVEFLDLSWYTPYKETMDGIISGFLWLLFVWGLFKQAPGIISGAGIVVNKAEDISEGKRGR